MGRSASLALLVLAALTSSGAGAAGLPLLIEAEVEPRPSTAIRVRATNTTGEVAQGATPEVIFRHGTATGEPVDLGAGGHHEWRIALPGAAEPGTAPATVRVRHRTARGVDAMGVAVVLVPTPGAAASPVRVSLSIGPVARHADGRIVLENTGPEPVAGRAFLMLPGGLTVDPQSQPAVVAPGASVTLTLVVENAGALPASAYPAYAVLQYAAGGVDYAAMAAATVAVEAPSLAGGAVPLLVGMAALTAALASLVVALRWSAARRPIQRV
jgi:hypothetical protein